MGSKGGAAGGLEALRIHDQRYSGLWASNVTDLQAIEDGMGDAAMGCMVPFSPKPEASDGQDGWPRPWRQSLPTRHHVPGISLLQPNRTPINAAETDLMKQWSRMRTP